MTHQSFKPGQLVAIINTTLSGKPILEGWAFILKPTGLADDHYTVRFTFASFHQEVVNRFVDPDAQEDPWSFVEKLKTMSHGR